MKFLQVPLAAALSVSLAAGSAPGMAALGATADQAARSTYRPQMQGDQRILHALNRFTFGPRPGDLAAVRTEGLDRWFEEQLHPTSIDDSALNTRLSQFPALQWSPDELLYRLPSNAVIRQIIAGKLPMPQSGVLHAVYENQIERVEARREQQGQGIEDKGQKINGQRDAMQAADSGDRMSADAPALETDPTFADAVLALPPAQRMMRLEAMQQPQLDGFFKALKGPQRQALTADMTLDERLTVQALEGPERAVVEELMGERLTRDIYSNAQLQEVMTDFWLNHFNVYLRKNETMPYYLVSYERDTIRPRALGRFEDLLEAVAHSPAMLLYLDNAESIGPDSIAAEQGKSGFGKNKKAPEGLNENYARELMELHTLGVNGGYTQADVIQAARILTGWTVDRPQRGGGFQFNPNRHEPGTKKVMGQKFKDNGEREGEELLHFLATRPATAAFLSRELAVRFVSDDPPQVLVDRMAQTYLRSGGDIAALLRTMERSPEFWSQDEYRAKVKTPLEYVVSAVRASGADVENFQPLIGALRQMGMPLYGCIPPTGYKWEAADWISTGNLVDRMNFALALSANRLPGITVAWMGSGSDSGGGAALSLLNGLDDGDGAQQSTAGQTPVAAPTAKNEEARLEEILVSGGVSATTRSAVLEQFEQNSAQAGGAMRVAANEKAGIPVKRQDAMLAGLLLGSPEFQRR
jgi:uncharacterized protein (DUF1800 family)